MAVRTYGEYGLEGWQVVEKVGGYVTWIQVYRDGKLGHLICWPDGEVTYALRTGEEHQETIAGGKELTVEDAQAACDKVWQGSLN